jgi:hypothetical protein
MDKFKNEVRRAPLVGYEGLYEINTDGKIWSKKREKFLKPGHGKYNIIILSRGGIKKSFLVHSLMIRSFIGDVIERGKTCVKHINGDNYDDRFMNLEVKSHGFKRKNRNI